MPRASGTKDDLRCSGCGRVLARNDAIKCPRCKTINPMTVAFATDLKPDCWGTTYLWRPDGKMASSIMIRKEVWLNIGRRPELPPDCLEYPVFFVYNYLDPSKAHSPDSGCCVNPEGKPYLKLDDALAIAMQMEQEALASGKWVRVEDLPPTLK